MTTTRLSTNKAIRGPRAASATRVATPRAMGEPIKGMKAAKTLKEGVKIGAECMTVKGKVRSMATALDNAEGFLDEMQEVMKGGGLECDDSTVLQKLKRIDISTIASEGGDLADHIKTVYDLVSNVAAAAA